MPHLQYINLLLELILTMAIFYLMNQIMKIFRTKYKNLKACLAITPAIHRTSRENIYDELGLHSLIKRRWRRQLIFFYKIVNGLLLDYYYYFCSHLVLFSRKLSS